MINKMGKGQKLYSKAKKIIPGGTMLLSKRPEMFLPDLWPSYFSKAKGTKVWDLDGNKFIDMSIMGIGTNSLGYANKEVDEVVINAVKKGNMSTLNSAEEVKLAEKIINLNQWADMVRFARTGGEANAIAVRISRAASGKDNIAICGYHGWHDWYLSANHNFDNNLSSHLLSGLQPNGVPLNLKNTVFPFEYNNFKKLEYLVNNFNIGTVKMEVIRNFEPKKDFLRNIRELTKKKGIVLIFDECTTGFRETYGGIYKKYGIEPDMAMYGKTIGNGYALTAVVGKKSIMKFAESTFISSTFWTERIGSVAAIKTLDLMEKYKSWEIITQKGIEFRKKLIQISENYNLPIKIYGIPSITNYKFDSPDNFKYKTYITQEMLKKGFLASTCFYASIKHTSKQIDDYFFELDKIFKTLNKCEHGNLKIQSLLDGKVCHKGFKRLN